MGKRWLFWCLSGLAVLLWFCPSVAAYRAPLQVQNRFPLHLLFLTPRPTSPIAPTQGSLRTSMALEYSSTYFEHSNSQWDYLIDLEMTVVDLSFHYGISSRASIRLDVPLVSMNAGFLDGFLQSYHDALGVPNYGRENRPQNSFAYSVSKEGRTWLEGESGLFRWSDMTVSAQYVILKPGGQHRWTSALQGSIKLPTGDPDRAYGSGGFDFGLFLPSQWSLTSWSLFIMPGMMLISDPETRGADVSARNSYSLFSGLAFHYNDKWSWLAQLNFFTSPIEETGLSVLDDGALELALGFQRVIKQRWVVEFAFCEDLTRAAPDFNVRLGLIWNYDFRGSSHRKATP